MCRGAQCCSVFSGGGETDGIRGTCCSAGISPDEGGSRLEGCCRPAGSWTFKVPLGGEVEWQATPWFSNNWTAVAALSLWNVSPRPAFSRIRALEKEWNRNGELIQYESQLLKKQRQLAKGKKRKRFSVEYSFGKLLCPISHLHNGFELFWKLCASKCIFYNWTTQKELGKKWPKYLP